MIEVLLKNIAMRSSPLESYNIIVNFVNQQPIRLNMTIPETLEVTF